MEVSLWHDFGGYSELLSNAYDVLRKRYSQYITPVGPF